MYEWLEREAAEIKTPNFHLFEPERADDLRSLPPEIYAVLPPSYVAFVSKLGAARLYRKNGYYLVGVLSLPVRMITKEGEQLLQAGHFDDAPSYFKLALLTAGRESPVFESDETLEEVAEGFEAWLERRCADAWGYYTEDERRRVLLGPEPFTPEEVAVVDARRHFDWRFLGEDEDGDLAFAIKNNSGLTLPYLTLGVTDTDNSVQGRLWLDVSGIRPGQEGVIYHPGYRGLIPPGKNSVYALPDPTPEERELYWEFKK